MEIEHLLDLVDPAHTVVLTMELQRGVIGDLAACRNLHGSSGRRLLPQHRGSGA